MEKKETEWLVDKRKYYPSVSDCIVGFLGGLLVSGCAALIVMAVTGVLQLFNLSCQCACDTTPIPPLMLFIESSIISLF